MYTLTCNISITTKSGSIRLAKVTSATVSRSIDSLTTTATVTLPRRIKWKGATNCPIRRGDPITIELGYDQNNRIAFVGYVSKVGTQTPLIIECADEMLKLRTTAAKKLSYASTDIATVLRDQGLDPVVSGKQSIGAYRICCNTVAELLDSLKKQNIRSFYRLGSGSTPRLFSGLSIVPDDVRTFRFSNTENMVDATNLNFQDKQDTLFTVKVVSHLDVQSGKKTKSQKVEVTVGDLGGEVRTFNVIGMNQAEMKEYGEKQYEQLKTGGLTGSFTAFGGDIIDKLDRVRLVIDGTDHGVYQVNANEISYGEGGFRQEITIGTRLSD